MSLYSILIKIQMMKAVHGQCSLPWECVRQRRLIWKQVIFSVAAFMEFLVEEKEI